MADNDVEMVALKDHLGYGYGAPGKAPKPISLFVKKDQKFVTNAARALRLVANGVAVFALDADAPEVATVEAAPEPESVKVDKRSKEYRDTHKHKARKR